MVCFVFKSYHTEDGSMDIQLKFWTCGEDF